MRSGPSDPLSHRPHAATALALLAALALVAGCAGGTRGAAAPGTPGDLAGAVVAVDAGHPSENGHGTRSRSGIVESHVTLAVALRLEALLTRRGATVVMTRTGLDQVVTNRQRAEIANRAGADLLVRLHCDTRAAPGTATYHPDRMGTTVDGVTGPSREVIERSGELARIFHPALIAAMGPGWGDVGILGDSRTAVGSRQGALTGSIFAEVPAITIEMVSLAHDGDAAFIATEAGQDRMARALAAGVEAYLRVAADSR